MVTSLTWFQPSTGLLSVELQFSRQRVEYWKKKNISLVVSSLRNNNHSAWNRRAFHACRHISQAAANDSALEDDYYAVLGIERTAEMSEVKKSYRKLALQYHPDVNPEPDAQDKFVKLSSAYDVLIDPEQRALYDKYGISGITGHENKSKGAYSAVWDDTWDEFKPHKRKTRKGDAREAAASSSSNGTNVADAEVAQLGDVVEYPLSQATRDRFDDGRAKGLGFVVGRNIDRGDKDRLSPENLLLVELEPLFKEEYSEKWQADPMESAAFASLPDLRVLQSEFDRVTDSWVVLDELSPGCGSPVYCEEVIV